MGLYLAKYPRRALVFYAGCTVLSMGPWRGFSRQRKPMGPRCVGILTSFGFLSLLRFRHPDNL